MANILNIKNIFKINISVYVLALIAILTASFKEFLTIIYLIVIHEIGHSLAAFSLGIKVKEIRIYPLGGISKFDMPLNINPLKELIVLINGPLFQEIAYRVASIVIPSQISLISTYHYNILIFNLLPIYPLDGGKLLKLITDKFIPYKNSLRLVILISYIMIIVFLFKVEIISINTIIICIFLLYLIIKEEKKINYIYNKFLLERYLGNYKFKDTTIIKSINNFHRNKNHLVKVGQKYYSEKDVLKEKYNKTEKNCWL